MSTTAPVKIGSVVTLPSEFGQYERPVIGVSQSGDAGGWWFQVKETGTPYPFQWWPLSYALKVRS